MSPLSPVEHELRLLLPAHLYTLAWVKPDTATLTAVFEHLRTLRHILEQYVPPTIATAPPIPGHNRSTWQSGTLLFTDLAGFTTLMEAYFTQGHDGADELLAVLNRYFGAMVEIISKSGGNLLEFTGDALLAEFPCDRQGDDILRAVRAGLRMQRAMVDFAHLETQQGPLSLRMRVGIHTGRFLTVDTGTPARMLRMLLGHAVHQAKGAEGSGVVGRVCLTAAAAHQLPPDWTVEPLSPHHVLVVDDFKDELGEYDITFRRRRAGGSLLFDRTPAGFTQEITTLVHQITPLASYLPRPVLELAVMNVSQRQIPARFTPLTVMFVSVIGVSAACDRAHPDEEAALVQHCGYVLSLIDGLVTAAGGIMKNPTYQLNDPDILIYFGALNRYTDDARRAVRVAWQIQALIAQLPSLPVGNQPYQLACQIGIAQGLVFAAEIGEPRGRREFNILGDTVNIASRLTSRAQWGQTLITKKVYQSVRSEPSDEVPIAFTDLGRVALKGKERDMQIYEVTADVP
jgi:class 3 adenylate cyclase